MAYDVPQASADGLNERTIHGVSMRPIGAQPSFTAGGLERFLAAPRIAVLAYVRRDGRPGSVPIWYAYRDGTFALSSRDDAPKVTALRRDARVTLTIQDERPPYRAAVIDGVAEVIAPSSDDGTDSLATRYFGRVAGGIYRKMAGDVAAASGSGELTILVRPTEVRCFDNTRAIGAPTLAFVRLRNRLPIPRRWL